MSSKQQQKPKIAGYICDFSTGQVVVKVLDVKKAEEEGKDKPPKISEVGDKPPKSSPEGHGWLGQRLQFLGQQWEGVVCADGTLDLCCWRGVVESEENKEEAYARALGNEYTMRRDELARVELRIQALLRLAEDGEEINSQELMDNLAIKGRHKKVLAELKNRDMNCEYTVQLVGDKMNLKPGLPCPIPTTRKTAMAITPSNPQIHLVVWAPVTPPRRVAIEVKQMANMKRKMAKSVPLKITNIDCSSIYGDGYPVDHILTSNRSKYWCSKAKSSEPEMLDFLLEGPCLIDRMTIVWGDEGIPGKIAVVGFNGDSDPFPIFERTIDIDSATGQRNKDLELGGARDKIAQILDKHYVAKNNSTQAAESNSREIKNKKRANKVRLLMEGGEGSYQTVSCVLFHGRRQYVQSDENEKQVDLDEVLSLQ